MLMRMMKNRCKLLKGLTFGELFFLFGLLLWFFVGIDTAQRLQFRFRTFGWLGVVQTAESTCEDRTLHGTHERRTFF